MFFFAIQPNEKTPFHMVIEKNDYHFLRFSVNLLPESERKAILNMKDSLGNTCLHMCAVLTKHKVEMNRNPII